MRRAKCVITRVCVCNDIITQRWGCKADKWRNHSMENLEKGLFLDIIHKESFQNRHRSNSCASSWLNNKCLLLADTRTDIWDFFYLFKHGSKYVIKACILNSWLLFKTAVIKHFQKTETMYPNQTNVQMFWGQISTFRGESPCEVMVGQVVTGMFRKIL